MRIKIPRPVLLRGFLMFVMTCHGLALIHDDESLLAAGLNPDAPSFPHVLQPIATSEVIPHVLQPFPTSKVNTAHPIPPLEEITTPAASTSFKQLGRLPASNKLNPPNNSGGLTSHFIPHAVSFNYWSDFELMGHVEHPSRIDQIMEEYQRFLESPPEEPLDVRKNNRNPKTTFQSADHEKQTTQNLGDIHDSSGTFDLYTQLQIMKVASKVDSPSSSPQDLQISSFSPGINLSQKRKPESAANLNESRSKKRTETSPFLMNVDKFTQDSKCLLEQTESLLSKYTENGSSRRKKAKPRDIIRFEQFSKKMALHSAGIHNHGQQPRLPCIDEEGSLILHSGAFNIENPSSTDTGKIQIFKSMIDGSDTPEKQFLISEDVLETYVEYFHKRSSLPKEKTKLIIGGEEKETIEKFNKPKMRDNKRETAVTTFYSKLNDWLEFYEAKCGIESPPEYLWRCKHTSRVPLEV
jgi:hypothetical protein